MSQQSASAELESTWGKFSSPKAAEVTQTKLLEAGIEPANITLETEDFQPPTRLEDTEAIANLKTGAIVGGILGGLIGLSISLILINFYTVGLAALKNLQSIHYLLPLLGVVVGAVGMSLISGLSGANIPKSNADNKNNGESLRYLVVVKGTTEEVNLAREIINSQDGIVEEADRR